jgi:Hsp20/alpha crystallin family
LQTCKCLTMQMQGVRYHRSERSSMFTRRSIRLPETADLKSIKAKFENGTLSLEVPKLKVWHRQLWHPFSPAEYIVDYHIPKRSVKLQHICGLELGLIEYWVLVDYDSVLRHKIVLLCKARSLFATM